MHFNLYSAHCQWCRPRATNNHRKQIPHLLKCIKKRKPSKSKTIKKRKPSQFREGTSATFSPKPLLHQSLPIHNAHVLAPIKMVYEIWPSVLSGTALVTEFSGRICSKVRRKCWHKRGAEGSRFQKMPQFLRGVSMESSDSTLPSTQSQPPLLLVAHRWLYQHCPSTHEH